MGFFVFVFFGKKVMSFNSHKFSGFRDKSWGDFEDDNVSTKTGTFIIHMDIFADCYIPLICISLFPCSLLWTYSKWSICFNEIVLESLQIYYFAECLVLICTKYSPQISWPSAKELFILILFYCWLCWNFWHLLWLPGVYHTLLFSYWAILMRYWKTSYFVAINPSIYRC